MKKRRSPGERGRGRRSESAFDTINITPFTDVLLVLLVIFMIAGSSLVPTGVQLSKLAAGAPDEVRSGPDKTFLRVEIGAKAVPKLTYGDHVLTESELGGLAPGTRVELAIEPQVKAETVVRVYDRLLKAGLSDVEWGPPTHSGSAASP